MHTKSTPSSSIPSRNTIYVVMNHNTRSLADMLEVLETACINVEHIDAESLSAGGIISLTVDSCAKVHGLLSQHGFNTVSEEAVLTCIPDEPGAQAALSRLLKEAGLETRSMRIITRMNGICTVAVVTSNNERALELFQPTPPQETCQSEPAMNHDQFESAPGMLLS